ncbi:uncharacterized protein LOC115675526 isoform X1 [Syzygium oleosum]|uniref:uncharacterized protein LOC115675526 isoform X1 n=1 Tax=Syzygium oleosum TaxID=219896 RepID=UPI0024BBA6D6|nr:uncharacterized protein LOC115675526 isoform X1 [Syzygium oleosum]
MEASALTTVASMPTSSRNGDKALVAISGPFPLRRKWSATGSFRLRRRFERLTVLASKEEEPRLNQWDQMELKFGRMLGEDPKLTMAKIMGRKANPDASFLEIEKSFYKKKGDIKEVPFEGTEEGKSSSSSDGLNLARPVPKKGVKFQSDKPMASEPKRPTPSAEKSKYSPKSSVPDVILRKPTVFNEDDVEDKPSKLRIKRNLSLRMSNQPVMKERFSDMTLLRKPEPTNVNRNLSREVVPANASGSVHGENSELQMRNEEIKVEANDFTLIKKPETVTDGHGQVGYSEALSTADGEEKGLKSVSGETSATTGEFEASTTSTDVPLSRIEPNDDIVLGSQLHEQSHVDSGVNFGKTAALQGKPKRMVEHARGISNSDRVETSTPTFDRHGDDFKLGSVCTPEVEDRDDADWTRAEHLVKTGEREEVELLSSSTRGFVVSFGSLIGILPYRSLATKWKYLAFESWLIQKGLDPSKYRQNLGVIGSYDVMDKSSSTSGGLDPEDVPPISKEISPDMKLEDLLRIYDQEKLKFLSSFVGQKIKVNVVVADRKFRKLLFSVKPKEKEAIVEKKRSLMAKLRIGDVVKCCIKKITYFGIFVEVEGVPALIHQTEVSWDATLDPVSYFKIGQVVEAKVHQLDFALERIFLSLKEIMPDPLIEALESVVGDGNSFDWNLEATQAESEWVEVESLIKELQQIEGVHTVSKGRFFLSPGLAPTFQVYMASMFENQYKLLARSGNKVQEVIVEASLDKEDMKSIILMCTNQVE